MEQQIDRYKMYNKITQKVFAWPRQAFDTNTMENV